MPAEQDIMETTAPPEYGLDLPVSFYDRPTHALYNLLIRGNFDAATRSIFQPDTLSPVEMQTLTNRLAGPKPNPLMKTILDVSTNPLVIAGLIGGYLLWPAAGAGTLAKTYAGLRVGVPESGLVGKFVGGAFSRLRHLVLPGATKGAEARSMHGALMDVKRSIVEFVTGQHKPRVEAYGFLGAKVGKNGDAGRRVAAGLMGWYKGPDSDIARVLG